MKNKFLLLGGIAIIAIASAVDAAVDDPLTSEIGIEIGIINPATIRAGEIYFPTIFATGGRVVTIDAEGSIVTNGDHATTALTLDNVGEVVGIFISGGDAGDIYDDASHSSSLISNITIASPVILTDESGNNSGECGTVDYFTPGDVEHGTITEEGINGVSIRYGATFTMKEGFSPTNGRANCTGSAEVTYIPYNF